MLANVYGRENYLEKIKKYAESSVVGNQAFLGVKGVGKTSLFQAYFTKAKRGELAQNYKKLFVFSQLDSRKQGSDLYRFLLEQVKIGIMGIPDMEAKKSIKSEMKDIDEIFETPDGRLNQYLAVIKEYGYDLIIIMDQFHCMARDTDIGKEQYDVLRSFNEQKLITYWIITDTDLMETCDTKQYIASFFAQKFTNKLTICPLGENKRMEVVNFFDNQKKAGLSISEKEAVAEVSGGIPELMSILMDILCQLRNEEQEVSVTLLEENAVVHQGCISLFDGWVSGLNEKQKKILYQVATSENGIAEERITRIASKMAELADDVGRGLLHVYKENDEKIWCINIELFRKYILNCGDDFYQERETVDAQIVQEIPMTLPERHVTNNYYIEGNFIHSQTNNILSIENAVAGLEDLQKLMKGNPVLLDESQIAGKLDYLPFKQEAWAELSEDEQEEKIEKYADGIFASDIFSKELITPEVMRQFCLTEELLGALSNSCRTQIVCGVQVYNLIQRCIDNFGLKMNESESPRGILFARAFEKHLKDFAAPAYCRVPELATQNVYPTTKPFKEYPIDKTTIGTYSSILGYGYRIFAQASEQLLGYTDRDEDWWKKLVDRLSAIGDLRNQCCHSGTSFGKTHLDELIERIFVKESLKDILIFGEIPTLQRNQFPVKGKSSKSSVSEKQKSVGNRVPDISLLGKRVQFKILTKTDRGNFKGIVNNVYEGSLPKSCTKGLDFNAVKNTTISVVADKIQDGKYVLKV